MASAAHPRTVGVASSRCSFVGGRHVLAVPARRPTSFGDRSGAGGTTAAVADPLLLRVARGEDAERTPVWLMRQAGRYMAAFREYSNKYGFRKRSETPDIAIELSLQPDGVIMFSDILTPLPALGIEFDVIKGKGPIIPDPIRTADDLKRLRPMDDPESKIPFIRPILSALRKEVGGASTVLGFVGTPWTLAAYAVEGKADKHCMATKTLMLRSPAVLHALLAHLSDALATYLVYQIDSGAQVVQLFDSWAHHLSPAQFAVFSAPYAARVAASVRAQRPGVPIIYHANGGTGKLGLLTAVGADAYGLDWGCTVADARAAMPESVLQGNMDPMVLFGTEAQIRAAAGECIAQAGGRRFVLNVGHGVAEGTPEDAVGLFCQVARESGARAK